MLRFESRDLLYVQLFNFLQRPLFLEISDDSKFQLEMGTLTRFVQVIFSDVWSRSRFM